MEDLEINKTTTLCLPDKDGDIEIEIDTEECHLSEYVSFKKLEKWVASIREQIIKSSKGQAEPCWVCKKCNVPNDSDETICCYCETPAR